MRRKWILIVAALLAGCSSKPTLAGSDWTTNVLGGTTDFSFSHDGSMKMNFGLPMLGKLPASGTFSETTTALTLTLQRIELPNNPLASQAKRFVDEMVGRPISFRLEWKSPDEVVLSPVVAGGPLSQQMTLKRRPE